MSRFRWSALAAFVVGLSSAAMAAEPVVVTLDQAKVVRIAAPAGTIIIGNPAIADATLQDAQTLVITGRSYGSTNMIVLDADGEPISDTIVSVQGPSANMVTVFRGAARSTFSCVPECQPAAVPGDADIFFGGIQSQTAARNGAATGQAATAQPPAAN